MTSRICAPRLMHWCTAVCLAPQGSWVYVLGEVGGLMHGLLGVQSLLLLEPEGTFEDS